jgi:hypothetical protein
VLKHKSLVMVSILVLVLAVVAMSCAPAKPPAPPPAPPAPPVVAPPVVTPPVVTPPVVTPPVAPAIVEKVTSYAAKKFSNDKLSIAYPADWVDTSTKISGAVFYGKSAGKDLVFVAIRPATDFKAAANTFLADLIAASGAAFSPSVDSETTVTLADGTKAQVILLSAAFGMAKAAITGVIKDGNAIMVVGATDPKSMALYQEIGSTLIVK